MEALGVVIALVLQSFIYGVQPMTGRQAFAYSLFCGMMETKIRIVFILSVSGFYCKYAHCARRTEGPVDC